MAENNYGINIEIPEQIADAIATPTKNLTDAPTRSLGEGIGAFFDLTFDKIRFWRDKHRIKNQIKLEQYKAELLDEINKISVEKQCEPDYSSVMHLMEKSIYCINADELRKMFVKLISGTMDIDKKDFIHPAYAEIVNQMSPLDAKVFKVMQEKQIIPICQILLNFNNIKGHQIIKTNVALLFQTAEENDISAVSVSLTNLERLGLISISYLNWLINDDLYIELNQFMNDFSDINNLNGQTEMQKGRASLTPFGENLANICISD